MHSNLVWEKTEKKNLKDEKLQLRGSATSLICKHFSHVTPLFSNSDMGLVYGFPTGATGNEADLPLPDCH